MIRVYADMVADLFHYGHVEFLKRARALGDHLVVGIHSDEVVLAHKRQPIMTMDERIACMAGCRYVDEVIGDAPWIMDRDWIAKHKIDLVVHGDDYSQEALIDTYGISIELGILRTLSYTATISTTEIIRRIRETNP